MTLSEHDNRVESLVLYLVENGYQIAAAIYAGSPYNKPAAVGRHEPDVIGKIGNSFIIGEAKTEEDYKTDHSMEQYRDFGISGVARVFLHLPLNLHNEVNSILTRLGVKEKYTLVYFTKEAM